LWTRAPRIVIDVSIYLHDVLNHAPGGDPPGGGMP
jgi:hypothetical protein